MAKNTKESSQTIITERMRQDVAVDIWLDAVESVTAARESAGLPALGMAEQARDEIDGELCKAIAVSVFELAGVYSFKEVMSNAVVGRRNG